MSLLLGLFIYFSFGLFFSIVVLRLRAPLWFTIAIFFLWLPLVIYALYRFHKLDMEEW